MIPKDKLSEERFAKWFGKRNGFSGAKLDSKLDVIGKWRYEGLRGENKFTQQKSYSFKLETLQKAKKQAAVTGDRFIFRVEFEDNQGRLWPFILQEEDLYRDINERSDTI